jgi:hypothetical protein
VPQCLFGSHELLYPTLLSVLAIQSWSLPVDAKRVLACTCKFMVFTLQHGLHSGHFRVGSVLVETQVEHGVHVEHGGHAGHGAVVARSAIIVGHAGHVSHSAAATQVGHAHVVIGAHDGHCVGLVNVGL